MEMVLNWASEPDAHYGLDQPARTRAPEPARTSRTTRHTSMTKSWPRCRRASACLHWHRQAVQVLLHSGLRLASLCAPGLEIEGDCLTSGRTDERPERRASRTPVPITAAALRKVRHVRSAAMRGDFVFPRTVARDADRHRGGVKERLDRLMLQCLEAGRRRARHRPLRHGAAAALEKPRHQAHVSKHTLAASRRS
jgi:hypothetical protein